ncbi:MAG: hypothetical protein QXP04_05175 [Candidatus Nanoarchaeia archaeon]|nr:hypothetical protein [Candidatus Jingweiarchaeum tengchongense]
MSLPRKGETRNENLLDETAVRAYPATAEGGDEKMSWRYQGVGKTEGEKWRAEMESKGFVVEEKYTTDNEWGNRPIRWKDEKFVGVVRVWAAGRGRPGLWYYARRP